MPRPPLAFPAAALVLGVLAPGILALAPALADGMPGPARHGYDRPHADHHAPRRGHHLGHGRAHDRFAFAPPAGPFYHAWPEPAEVRVPIYNRPSHLPPSW